MTGRIFNIKKTTILKLSFIFNSFIAVLLSVLSFIYKGANDDYFFLFCNFLGLHLLVKSALFGLDSTCYLGSALFFCGAFYFYCDFLMLSRYYIVFLVLAFCVASFFTHCFFVRPVHLNVAFALLCATIFTFLFVINSISLWVFLAILVVDVLLLTVRIFTL